MLIATCSVYIITYFIYFFKCKSAVLDLLSLGQAFISLSLAFTLSSRYRVSLRFTLHKSAVLDYWRFIVLTFAFVLLSQNKQAHWHYSQGRVSFTLFTAHLPKSASPSEGRFSCLLFANPLSWIIGGS